MHTMKRFHRITLLTILLMTGPLRLFAQEFVVNPARSAPYRQFKFRVKWDGKTIPGILRVSGLHRKTEVVTMKSGNDSGGARKLPGKTAYAPIVLERGRTHDTSFEQWAEQVYRLNSGSTAQPQNYTKDIVIELYNEAGQLAMAFRVTRCWPSDYAALDELNAESTDIAIERLVLEHEGWERDKSVAEPAEPRFTDPQ